MPMLRKGIMLGILSHCSKAAQSVKKVLFAGCGAAAPLGVQGPKAPQYSLPRLRGRGRPKRKIGFFDKLI